MIVTEEREIRF